MLSISDLSSLPLQPSVLWLNSSTEGQKMVGPSLNAQTDLEVVSNLYLAAEILMERHFDFLVLNEKDYQQENLGAWLHYHFPELRLIRLIDLDSQLVDISNPNELRQIQLRSDLFFSDPIFCLKHLLPLPLSTAELRHLDLLALIHYLCCIGAQKKLQIYDASLDRQGYLLISEQQIVAAEFEESQGPSAVHQLLSLNQGFIAESPINTMQRNIPRHYIQTLIALSAKQSGVFQYIQRKEQQVLIVEHDRDLHAFYLELFKSFGINPYLAHSAHQARIYLNLRQFDYIFLDLSLPENQGRALLHEIQQHHAHRYLLLSSDIHSSAIETMAYQMGAIAHLTKPFKEEELRNLFAFLNRKRTFHGYFRDLDLHDGLKLIMQGRNDSLLKLSTPDGPARCFFQKGELIYAQSAQQQGSAALSDLLLQERIHYAESFKPEAPGKNMAGSVWKLLQASAGAQLRFQKPSSIQSLEDKLACIQSLRQAIQSKAIQSNGDFEGLEIGQTRLEDRYLVAGVPWTIAELLPMFHEVGLELTFDARGLLEQIGYASLFQGQTQQGLKIGDSFQTAVSKYGQPQYFDRDCAVWKQISVFFNAQKEVVAFYYGAI